MTLIGFRSSVRDRAAVWLAAAVVIVAGALPYGRSLPYPFIFDDEEAIIENRHLRRLWPPTYLWECPPQSTIAGRPLLSLTLAVNYALGGPLTSDVKGGPAPWGYRALNVAIHLAAALTLFGVLRRTFLSPRLHSRCGGRAVDLALAAALLWAVHPLQTESVTYVIQRGESLMGLLFLLTLYCSIRALQSARPTPWSAAAVLTCAAGMAAKEVMVTAPLLVLLHERIFFGASFARRIHHGGTEITEKTGEWAALRRRRFFYGALAATWIILAALVITGPRSASAGLGLERVTPLSYALTQPGVILHYLLLTIWPRSLCLDYWWPIARTAGEIVPPLTAVFLLILATAWALARRPAWGYLGAWFFLILAPTSSLVPILDPAFEHRMYLPLAAVIVLAVVGGWGVWHRLIACASHRLLAGATLEGEAPAEPCGPGFQPVCDTGVSPVSTVPAISRCHTGKMPVPQREGLRRPAAAVVVLAVAAALGFETARRNEDYRSALVMWSDVVAKRPENPRAHNNLAEALRKAGDRAGAIAHLRQALRIRPDYDLAHGNLAVQLAEEGEFTEALAHAEEAVRLQPQWARAHAARGGVLAAMGSCEAALQAYERALALDSEYAEAEIGAAHVLGLLGRLEPAAAAYAQALRDDPDLVEVRNDLAAVLLGLGRAAQAEEQLRIVVRERPEWSQAWQNLGLAQAAGGRVEEAVESYRAAVRLKPDYAEAYYNLGNALVRLGRTQEAAEQYALALSGKPDYLEAEVNLAGALRGLGRAEEAERHARSASVLALRRGEQQRAAGRLAEAVEMDRLAVRIDPRSDEAQYRLGRDLIESGQTVEGMEALRRAVEINPRHAEARRMLEGRE